MDATVAGGIAPVFVVIHTGYDKVIYGLPGTKYSTAIKTTIDNVSYVDNTNTLKFGFSATGSLGVGGQAASSANIVPTILVGLYGFDTKDYLFGPHESYPSTYPDNALKGRRFLEFSTATPAPANNSAYITVTKSGSAWNVTANLSTWKPWIDNNSVKRVEVAVMPALRNADNVIVALNAPSKTFNLKTKAVPEPALLRQLHREGSGWEDLGHGSIDERLQQLP